MVRSARAGDHRLDQRRAVGRRLAEVGVQQQQRPGFGPAVALLQHAERIDGRLDRRRLAAIPFVRDDDRARGSRVLGRPVAAAVVADDHQVDPGRSRAAPTVAAIRASSSFAGMMHTTRERAALTR